MNPPPPPPPPPHTHKMPYKYLILSDVQSISVFTFDSRVFVRDTQLISKMQKLVGPIYMITFSMSYKMPIHFHRNLENIEFSSNIFCYNFKTI